MSNYLNIFKEYVINGVREIEKIGDNIGEELGKRLGLPYTSNLNDDYLLKLLAACAKDCYIFDDNALGNNHLERVYKQEENMYNTNGLQFGVYKILSGNHTGKKILAYRGTATMMGILQDAALINPAGPLGIVIKMAICAAVDRANEQNADFICGHSLGGFMAECVCAQTGIPGASFNAPGPWAANSSNNCAQGNKYDGVPFECHLTETDYISHFGSMGGPDSSHIGKPKWRHGPAADAETNHSMEAMLDSVGRL